jgi:8-oxo-dGTP pyrophosphatase MutT (NUDIX family)
LPRAARLATLTGVSDLPKSEVPLAHAATVVVLRDAPQGLEVLLMLRASELVFHGGAWVFPGGRVDAADEVPGDAVETARHAAVREAFEEAGLTLAPSALVPISHWTTPHGRPRRFATWFFATALDTPVDVVVDGSEISTHCWLRPEDALQARARGELELPVPTFVTLSTLCAHRTTAAYLASVATSEPQVFVPRPRSTEQGIISLYEGDRAYDGGDTELAGPRHRLSMFKSGWCYEQSAD